MPATDDRRPTADRAVTDPGDGPREGSGGPAATVDVAVIGGGLAGVVAAAVAARAGATVLLCEQRSRLGGRGETARQQGFHLNVGPHALYVQGAAAQLARRLEVPLPGGPPALEQPMGRVADRVETFPLRAKGLATTRLVATRAKPQLGAVFAAVAAGKRRPDDDESVQRWLERLSDRDDVRTLLASVVRLGTYAHAPELFSAGAAYDQLGLSAKAGVRYLDGGWATLIDGFRAVAEAAGAGVRTGCAITSVRRTGATWQLVPDGGGASLPEARTVIVAAGGPERAAGLIGATPAGWERSGPPITASVLDVGFAGAPTHPFLHGVDRPLYLSTHCPPAALAPAGHSLVTAARYHAPGEQLDPDVVRAELTAHARLAGADVDGAVLRRYLHRLTVAHGMPLARHGGCAGRPPVAVAGHPGLFVAGDWVGGEGLLADASAASAARAADAAVAHTAAGTARATALR
ncbi:MAG: FAD-dependent oxidoreductase [Acidimicrobiia bacterium]